MTTAPDGQFCIRRATPADAERIWRLHVDAIRRSCAIRYTPEQIEAWTVHKSPEDYLKGLARGESIFVAEAAGAMLGFASSLGSTVLCVYVSPDAQRRGLGAALVGTIEADARRRGVIQLELKSTLNAVEFYRSNGYHIISNTVHVIRGVPIPCVAMAKTLDSQKDHTTPAPAESPAAPPRDLSEL
jgi:ribosomal protein S18 acetylase RimI-like enzyme